MKNEKKTFYRKTCPVCGCVFIALNARAMYHAPKCRLKAWRERNKPHDGQPQFVVDTEGITYRVYPIGDEQK